jgi:hypothetical protein
MLNLDDIGKISSCSVVGGMQAYDLMQAMMLARYVCCLFVWLVVVCLNKKSTTGDILFFS